jgi:uncharacterized protein YdcH (DUF465 family)
MNLRSPGVIIGVSFLLIWYAVMHQKVKEKMTGAVRLKEDDKKKITDFIILSIANPAESKKIVLSPEAQGFMNFLDQNPITAIDDKFMTSMTEIVKRLAGNDFMMKRLLDNPDTVKDGVRAVTKIITAHTIWLYADSYEKLKETPTQSEFREQLTALMSENPQFKGIINVIRSNDNSLNEVQNNIKWYETQVQEAKNSNNDALVKSNGDALQSQKNRLSVISTQQAAFGKNTYPLGSSTSPMVNQILDTVYKYYFGETVSASGLASGAWKAIVGIFGSLGAIALVAGIVYFVFLR